MLDKSIKDYVPKDGVILKRELCPIMTEKQFMMF